ncbi:Emopamil binding protein-domain-containing protein [Kalaharituber pfeilii]|nr:Emopamil binding protein-domain-containing protein [Kalaharituber pfeilii]
MADHSRTSATQHPYYPTSLALPGYDPANAMSQGRALATFFIPMTVIVGAAWLWARRVKVGTLGGGLSSWERFLVMWYVMCSALHIFFEGYYVTHAGTMHSSPDAFSILWREYALADSRYLLTPHPDPFVFSVELFTVLFVGPACALAAYLTGRRHPGRYVVQAGIATAHLCGVTSYFGTAMVESWEDGSAGWYGRWCRPEKVFVWGYLVGLNLPWLIVSLAVLWGAWRGVIENARVGGEVRTKRE